VDILNKQFVVGSLTLLQRVGFGRSFSRSIIDAGKRPPLMVVKVWKNFTASPGCE
jgi:hypothetical protein